MTDHSEDDASGRRGEYCVVLPLAPLAVGASHARARWPLHVTLVPNFVTAADAPHVIAAVDAALQGIEVLRGTVGSRALFGPAADVPVHLVESQSIGPIHSRVTTEVRARLPLRWITPAWLGDGFRPHITDSPLGVVHPGGVIDLPEAALVDLAPVGRPGDATTIATFGFRPGATS